ncbi:hypothetical protein C8J56DRAFT_974231 [Mycena floridula]|nr:hypothetical protein C8J56DRAFT_974231 [Mycena floridula]
MPTFCDIPKLGLPHHPRYRFHRRRRLMPFIDDRDPSISYAPGGFLGWSQGGKAYEFRLTTTAVNKSNATATVTFSGNHIAVFGTVQSVVNSSGRPAPTSTYTIDGGKPITFVPTLAPGSDDSYQQQFFSSDELTEGAHTLVIENKVDGPLFVIDYLEYSSSSNSTPSSLPVATSAHPTTSSPPSVSVGAAVGLALASSIVTLLLCLVILYIQRRKRIRNDLTANSMTPRTDVRYFVPDDEVRHPTLTSPRQFGRALSHHAEVVPPPYVANPGRRETLWRASRFVVSRPTQQV